MSSHLDSRALDRLAHRITGREAVVGVIGLGYVGLPLAVAVARAGYTVVGFDTDPEKPQHIAAGRSYIGAVMSNDLKALAAEARLSATTEFAALERCDVIIICVPTPLTRHRTPDLSYIEAMKELNLGVAGEFLVMAATLLQIKSKMLLPADETAADEEDGPDPREELVRRLLEYKQFKDACNDFMDRLESGKWQRP